MRSADPPVDSAVAEPTAIWAPTPTTRPAQAARFLLADLRTTSPTAEPDIRRLGDQADDATLGYLMARAEATADGWQIHLGARPRVADDLAMVLLRRGYRFGREGPGGNTIVGEGALPSWPIEDAQAALAGVVQLGATEDGRVLRTGGSSTAAAVEHLAGDAGVMLARQSGPRGLIELWVADIDGLETLGRLRYLCGAVLPTHGLVPCAETRDWVDDFADGQLGGWSAGVTLPLDPAQLREPVAEEVGVRWGNLEAQAYRPELIRGWDGWVELSAVPNPATGPFELPFRSAMIVSGRQFGYGRLDVTLSVPAGRGLWPAVWLLDPAACEAPGLCAGYETTDYLEIDLLEIDGAHPDTVHTSVHWFDRRLHTRTSANELPLADGGETHTWSLVRRPGLLVWLFDGVEIYRVTEATAKDRGPHRTSELALIINVAVGGTFAGQEQIGRGGAWWAEAQVPSGFPALGWNEATLAVEEIRFAALE